MQYKKFCLNIRKIFFSVRVAQHGGKLPREVVESLFMEI